MENNKNVGIWIRVSTDMQVQDESPEHHERRAKMYAETKGWNVVTIYRLDALSGKSIMDYPETKRMLKDIKNGTITGIIFSKLARLARNTKELLEISDIFQATKADLISLAENIDTSSPAGRLFFTIIAAMSQWEREEIAERVRASVPIRAQLGKPLSGIASFGYKWVDKKFVIDEQEAPIRRLMYEIFKQTKRLQATAKELNKRGYRTRKKVPFTSSTVERLIKESSAKGKRIANYTKNEAGKRRVLKPKEEWIEIECPAIVDSELWDECNQILNDREKRQITVGKQSNHLLTGLITCDADHKMYVYNGSPNYYKCIKCKRKIAITDIEEIFHQQLKQFLFVESDVETYNEKTIRDIEEKGELLIALRADYERLMKQMGEMMNMRIAGEISKEDFSQFYNPVQLQVRQIEQQLPEVQAQIDFLSIQNLSADVVLNDAQDLYNNWNSLSFEDKRYIVETIVERIAIGEDTIDVALSHLPKPHLSTNTVNSTHSARGAAKESIGVDNLCNAERFQ